MWQFLFTKGAFKLQVNFETRRNAVSLRSLLAPSCIQVHILLQLLERCTMPATAASQSRQTQKPHPTAIESSYFILRVKQRKIWLQRKQQITMEHCWLKEYRGRWMWAQRTSKTDGDQILLLFWLKILVHVLLVWTCVFQLLYISALRKRAEHMQDRKYIPRRRWRVSMKKFISKWQCLVFSSPLHAAEQTEKASGSSYLTNQTFFHPCCLSPKAFL